MHDSAVAMKKEICCLLRPLLDYVQHTPNLAGGLSGRAAVVALLDGVVDNPQFLIQDPDDPGKCYPVKEEHLRDRRYWISNELQLRVFGNAIKVIGGYRPLFQAGIIVGYTIFQEAQPKRLQFMRLFSPRRPLQLVSAINRRFNKTKTPKAHSYKDGHAIVKLNYKSEFKGCTPKAVCDYNAGIYTGGGKYAGAHDIEVKEIECLNEGGNDCVFEITWAHYGFWRRFQIFLHSITDPDYIMDRDLDNLRMNDLVIRQEGIIAARTDEYRTQKDRAEKLLSELRETQAKLIEADKVKSNFFANVSHEVRTPLTLIIAPIEAILQGEFSQAVDEQFFRGLHRNAVRLLELINTMLDFAKIEAGRMSMRVQPVDVVQTIKDWIGSIHSACESRDITLSFISLNKSVELWLDLNKFEKIVMNLFSNAMKVTSSGGQIVIRVKDDDRSCRFELEDTGIGIPEAKINAIFDRFTQIDSGSATRFEGTGIGLALVKEFVEAHGGRIEVESKTLDEFPHHHGTTFSITFPKGKKHFEGREDVNFVVSAKLEGSIADSWLLRMHSLSQQSLLDPGVDRELGVTNGSGASKILLVEDNPEIRSYIHMLLKEKYRVDFAVNGQEGLERSRQLRPDLIITDVMMPIMDGFEMTKLIKSDEALKRIPIIMITAKSEITNKIEGLEYGADDYLAKPFNSKELLVRIRNLLQISSLQKELLQLNENLQEEVRGQLETLRKDERLKGYLPPQLVSAILRGDKAVSFGTERRRLTIFFSDIRGFTSVTDALEAEDLSKILNEYFTEMTGIAHKWGGTVDKYIGDGIMIFFGAPETTDDKENALRCVNMAIQMQQRMKWLQDKWYEGGLEERLAIRIGINTGTATVGNFGTNDRLSYTAIGGQVNLASRLEGICEPESILVSHSTWALVLLC